MLCQFSFKNFKSYRDTTTLDCQATSISEFSESLISVDNCSSLLPVCAVYGPNGGGKSNLLGALICLISTVVKPIYDLGLCRSKLVLQQRVTCEPFLFDETSKNEPTEFSIFFRTSGYEYRYYLALLNGDVHAETLYRKMIGAKRKAKIYVRDKQRVELGSLLRSENISTNVNSKMPLLSFLSITYNISAIALAEEWFENCLSRNYANPLIDAEIMLFTQPEFKTKMITVLNNMGIDISDYRTDDEKRELFVKRRIGGVEYELPIYSESDGTKKMIVALPVFLTALDEGRLVIIDELDAKLHPKLLRFVISMFTNPEVNRYGAQLLFTSHDVSTMKNSVFRRDEIWFAAENDGHSSEIYSLYDIRREDNERVNSTAAYDKQYLEGRYGADPYLRNILNGDWI